MGRTKDAYFDQLTNPENENVPYEYLMTVEEWLEFNFTENNFLLREVEEMDKSADQTA
jgi:hypothetical protein